MVTTVICASGFAFLSARNAGRKSNVSPMPGSEKMSIRIIFEQISPL